MKISCRVRGDWFQVPANDGEFSPDFWFPDFHFTVVSKKRDKSLNRNPFFNLKEARPLDGWAKRH